MQVSIIVAIHDIVIYDLPSDGDHWTQPPSLFIYDFMVTFLHWKYRHSNWM